jgi:hypothetical protein
VSGLQLCEDWGHVSLEITREKKQTFALVYVILKFIMNSRFSLSVGPLSTYLSLQLNLKFIKLMTCENVTDNVFRYTEYSSVIFRIMGKYCNQTDFDQILITL